MLDTTKLLLVTPRKQMHLIQLLKKFYNVLKPGRILFILTKAGSGLLKKKEDLSSGEEREFVLLAKNELHRFLSKVGFQKQKLYTWNEKERFKKGRNLLWISAYYQKCASSLV